MTTEYKVQRLHPAQQNIVDNKTRYSTLVCGRRFGKTELCIRLALKKILDGGNVGWFAPNYKILNPVYNYFVNNFGSIIQTKNAQNHYIRFKNGAELDFWSLDTNDDAGRSRFYDLAIIDEAGMVGKLWSIWEAAIRPTLIDRKGEALFAGTPKGMTGFHKAYQLGIDPAKPKWSSFTGSTYANPYLDPEEIEEMVEGMSEDLYRQEVLAEFLDDSGSVFKNVSLVSTEEEIEAGLEGHDYIMGIDPARVNDFFVATVMDKREKRQVYLDRFKGKETKECLIRMRHLYNRFKPELIHIETNQNRSLYELMRDEGMPTKELFTTNKNKQEMIDALALSIEMQEVKLLNNNVQISELMAYNVERSEKSMNMKFGAPSGQHDDTVMALAMAHWFVKTSDMTFLERAHGGIQVCTPEEREYLNRADAWDRHVREMEQLRDYEYAD